MLKDGHQYVVETLAVMEKKSVKAQLKNLERNAARLGVTVSLPNQSDVDEMIKKRLGKVA
jgi:hypothetical protein